MPDRLLPLSEVLARVPFTRVHIWRLVRDGLFPAPLKLGPRKLAWKESAITDWIDSRPVVDYAAADAERVAS